MAATVLQRRRALHSSRQSQLTKSFLSMEKIMRKLFSKNALSTSTRLSAAINLVAILFICVASATAIAQTPNEKTSRSAPTTKTNPATKSDQGAASTSEQIRARRTMQPEPNAASNSSATRNDEAKDAPRIDQLREQIKTAASDDERFRLQRTLVDYLVALNHNREAVAQLRLMMREDRFDPTGFYNIGNALARLDDSNTAVDAYRKAIDQKHGNYSRALNNLGSVLLRLGRWDEAHDTLLAALTQESFRYSEASYNLGRLYAKRGDADAAIREWTRTLSIDPNHTDAALALARAYSEDGDPEHGLAVLDNFSARNGARAEFTVTRREILAARELEAAEAKSANTKPSGDAKTKTGVENLRPQIAASGLRTLTVDRGTYDVLQRARRAREAGRNEEAITYYRRVLTSRDNFFPPANLELSYAFISLHRTDEAIATLLPLATKAGARYPEANYHLARLYELRGDLHLAGDAYERAAAADKMNPQFLLDVSRVREKEGNHAGALTAFEAYLSRSEQMGRVPEWSTARLAELRQKAAASTAPPATTKR